MSVNHKLQGWIMLMSAVLLMPLTAAARFISVDRLAARYPMLSPYAYVANNPIIFIDANGDSIFVIINVDKDTYKSVNIVDLQALSDEDRAKLAPEVQAVLRDVENLESKPEGQKLVCELKTNDKHNVINPFYRGGASVRGEYPSGKGDRYDPTVGAGAWINYEPLRSDKISYVSLVHELIHVRHYNTGKTLKGVNPRTGKTYEQEKTVEEENRIRKEHELELR